MIETLLLAALTALAIIGLGELGVRAGRQIERRALQRSLGPIVHNGLKRNPEPDRPEDAPDWTAEMEASATRARAALREIGARLQIPHDRTTP